MTEVDDWLAAFNKSPAQCEAKFEEFEQRDAARLARELCSFASPQSVGSKNDLRFLALKFLQTLVARHWRNTSKSVGANLPPVVFSPADKQSILRDLLGDVPHEPVAVLGTKRAQIISEVARIDSFCWADIFTALLPPPNAEERDAQKRMRRYFCLHHVLKDLSKLRLGSHLIEFTRLGESLFAELGKRFQAAITTNADPEESCLVLKSLNALLAGSTHLQLQLVYPQFEACYQMLTRSVGGGGSGGRNNGAALEKHLRKVPLLALKSHAKWFVEQSFYHPFLTCTLQLMSKSPTTGGAEEENAIFAYHFWTLLIAQQQALDEQLVQTAMRCALQALVLPNSQVERWSVEGGELFCSEEVVDPIFDTKPSSDGSVRSAARRFLQACVDGTNKRAGQYSSVLFSLLQAQAPSRAMEWEALFFALQLFPLDSLFAWAGNGGELKSKVLACIKPSAPGTSIEVAILTRRALCLLQDFAAHRTNHAIIITKEEYYGILAALLGNAENEDLGVLMQCIEVWIAVISSPSPPFSLPDFAKYFSVPKIVILWRRLSLSESRVRIIDVFSAIVDHSPTIDPASLAFIMDEFVPFALLPPSPSHEPSASSPHSVTNDPFICAAVLLLIKACVSRIGFSNLLARSQEICVRFIQHCVAIDSLQNLDWACVLLTCLQTSEADAAGFLLLSQLSPSVLDKISDMSMRCQVLECIALLSPSSPNTAVDYSVTVLELWRYVESAMAAASTTNKSRAHGRLSTAATPTKRSVTVAASAQGGKLGEVSRTEEKARFILYDVYRCLGVLAHAKTLTPGNAVWSSILNSPLPAAEVEDDRDLIELITLKCQILLGRQAFFASLPLAQHFAQMCLKYFDAVGYSPRDIVWRNRLWVYSLFFLVAKCCCRDVKTATLEEVQCFLPSLIACCEKLVAQGNARPIVASGDGHLGSSTTPQARRLHAVFAAWNGEDLGMMFRNCWKGLEDSFGPEPLQALRASPAVQQLLSTPTSAEMNA